MTLKDDDLKIINSTDLVEWDVKVSSIPWIPNLYNGNIKVWAKRNAEQNEVFDIAFRKLTNQAFPNTDLSMWVFENASCVTVQDSNKVNLQIKVQKMRDITRKILALNLFDVLNIEVGDTNHWDDPDHITLLKNANAQVVLRISNQGQDSNLYTVSLEIDEYDSYGDIYLNDEFWFLFGNEESIISDIKLKQWNPIDLQPYAFHFK
ncbi:hypothetical protein [Acinetobacter nosocomialis]|uniref:hypothetical protein n=1 Tax=Acinetobacter nosocomialis TaxID=106654 RepID=UPI0029D6BE63|nr:hypothetical protein [Acinetobacter nosocomialis]MDX7882069.1 hypothetical protein [Acinetobacter nosocomialis]